MDYKLTPAQLKKIEEIHKLFLTIESSSKDAGFELDLLEMLITMVRDLANEESVLLKKLAERANHLNAAMTLRHFVNQMIPFERALQRNFSDDEFLIYEHDQPDRILQRVPLVFVLENIRSAFNVGAIFRTAECLGAEEVILTGYTPSPLSAKIEKTAMGSINYLKWSENKSTFDVIDQLKQKKYHVIGLETAPSAKHYTAKYPKGPIAFVLGNERYGLEKDVLNYCDEVRKISVFGIKNSLNVGIAAGVVGFEWRNQFENKTLE